MFSEVIVSNITKEPIVQDALLSSHVLNVMAHIGVMFAPMESTLNFSNQRKISPAAAKTYSSTIPQGLPKPVRRNRLQLFSWLYPFGSRAFIPWLQLFSFAL